MNNFPLRFQDLDLFQPLINIVYIIRGRDVKSIHVRAIFTRLQDQCLQHSQKI